MRCISGILILAAVSAFSCGALNAGGLEKEAADSSAFSLAETKAAGGIVPPAPRAADAGAGSAAEMDGFFKYLGDIFNAPRARPLRGGIGKSVTDIAAGRAGAVVYSFKLDSMLNSYIDSGLSFRTPHGVNVKFSGYTAANCPDGGQSCADKERIFLILSAGPGETYFVKTTEIVNALFMSGLKKIIIGGDELTVKIYAILTDIPSSMIEITCGGSKVFDATLKQLADAVAGKDEDIRLSRPYNLFYGNELLQGKGGARFSAKLVILLSPVGVPGYYFLNRADIKASGVTYPEMEPNFGFRITGNVLEIFRLE